MTTLGRVVEWVRKRPLRVDGNRSDYTGPWSKESDGTSISDLRTEFELVTL